MSLQYFNHSAVNSSTAVRGVDSNPHRVESVAIERTPLMPSRSAVNRRDVVLTSSSSATKSLSKASHHHPPHHADPTMLLSSGGAFTTKYASQSVGAPPLSASRQQTAFTATAAMQQSFAHSSCTSAPATPLSVASSSTHSSSAFSLASSSSVLSSSVVQGVMGSSSRWGSHGRIGGTASGDGTKKTVHRNLSAIQQQSSAFTLPARVHLAPPPQTEKVLPVYSAFKVLDAKSMSNDFYHQCLSFGEKSVATCLGQQVLLFSPDDLSSYGTTTLPLDWSEIAAQNSPNGTYVNPYANPPHTNAVTGLSAYLRTPTAIFMSFENDATAFVGDAEGGACVVRLKEGSNALSIVAYYDGRRGDGSPSSALTSAATVHCITSSPYQPHVFIAGYGDGSIRLFDTKLASPSSASSASSSASPPFLLTCIKRVAIPMSGPTRQLLIGARHRVVSLDINCTGSLLAAGTSNGLVQVYPLSADLLESPLMEWEFRDWSAAKALAFHPRLPNELSIGGGMGDGVIRTIDTHQGAVTAMVKTRSQVTQLCYSADGSHLVSTHGFAVKDRLKPTPVAGTASSSSQQHRSAAPSMSDLADLLRQQQMHQCDSHSNHMDAMGAQLEEEMSLMFVNNSQHFTSHQQHHASSEYSADGGGGLFRAADSDGGRGSAIASPVDMNPHEVTRNGDEVSGDVRGRHATTQSSSSAASVSSLPTTLCPIPSNSVVVWSRRSTQSMATAEFTLPTAAPLPPTDTTGSPSVSLHSDYASEGEGHTTNAHATANLRSSALHGSSNGTSPLTDAGRATLRRAHSAYGLDMEGSALPIIVDEGLRSRTPIGMGLGGGARQLGVASQFAAASLFPTGRDVGVGVGGARTEARVGGGRNASPSGAVHTPTAFSSNWKKELCLTQHTSRPLSLTRCRNGRAAAATAVSSGGSDTVPLLAAACGVFATAAGGDDSSIRLWRLIAPCAVSGGAPSSSLAGHHAVVVGGRVSGAIARRSRQTSPLSTSSLHMLEHGPANAFSASNRSACASPVSFASDGYYADEGLR